MKTYMLAQWGFWVQQVVVINIEERRKDHWQMLTHHFITLGLIYASYCYRHTRVGNVILVIMDIADIFLPVSFAPELQSQGMAYGTMNCLIESKVTDKPMWL